MTNIIPENNSEKSYALFSSTRGQLLSTSQLKDKFQIDILRYSVDISPNGKKVFMYLCLSKTDFGGCVNENILATVDLSITTNVRTNMATKVKDLGNLAVASWSPDSTHLIIEERKNGFLTSTYTMDETGEDIRKTPVMENAYFSSYPFWSFNSKEIYWQEGAKKLNIANIDGSNTHSITLDYLMPHFNLDELQFSQDGAKVLFIEYKPYTFMLYVTDGNFTNPITFTWPRGKDYPMGFKITWSLNNEYAFVSAYYFDSFMTLLQILGFQKLQIISSHFDGVFGRFHQQVAVFRYVFANFLPLSPNENGAPTFLQWSHL